MQREWLGSKWIRKERRLAIYLRDGLACVYCGVGMEDGAFLSLDHVKPWSKGGNNESCNLVTCCKRCNDSRGNRGLRAFTEAVAAYLNHGVEARDIERHVRNCQVRKTDVAFAKKLIAVRGSYGKALNTPHLNTRKG